MLVTLVRRVAARQPLIQFRQGKAPHSPASPAAPTAQGGSGKRTVSGGIIEDWQLPARFRRRPISAEECEAINMGGAI